MAVATASIDHPLRISHNLAVELLPRLFTPASFKMAKTVAIAALLLVALAVGAMAETKA